MLWYVNPNYGFLLCEKCGSRTLKAVHQLTPAGLEPGIRPQAKKIVFVCRNPYARAVSAWWDMTHACREGNLNCIAEMGSDDFPAFVAWYTGDVPKPKRSIYSTQTGWIGDMHVDIVLRLETLDHELPSLLGDVEIPHENATDHEPWPTYYNDDTEAAISRWAADDFRRFGYGVMVPCGS